MLCRAWLLYVDSLVELYRSFGAGEATNHIVIDHPTVSAQHAVLLRTGNSDSLKDLNSTNGTQVNADFVTDAELKDGDTIRFGFVTAVFARSPVAQRPSWRFRHRPLQARDRADDKTPH